MLTSVTMMMASIPSPNSNGLEIGPLTFNYYGLAIGIGVVVAVMMGQRRWTRRGGHPDDIPEIAKWAVPAGVIGARVYHIITDWRPIEDWLKIWEGGLGIPGGLIGGIGVGYLVARRRLAGTDNDMGNMMDAAIPGIPVAQAIGRLGNWFNQEIFGGPSDLPWAVEIDEAYRPAEFADESTFHPAFLYEATWNLLLAAFLIWIDRRGVLKRGMILPLYVAGYGIGRFLVEAVRIDPATDILGIRVNHWMSGLAVVVSAAVLVLAYRNARPSYWADGERPVDGEDLDLAETAPLSVDDEA
ncbi:MAG: prolipoprotein diacylglyceryl transferase [Acidimicrobiia bacterium]|nr:prolipoprotein diacylglyceryl transferase [Acidimicrobiia bacterium]